MSVSSKPQNEEAKLELERELSLKNTIKKRSRVNSDPLKLSIVIPAHNEEARIASTLESYSRYFIVDKSSSTEIIVIINGSTDRTVEIVHHIASKYPLIDSINVPSRIGKGGAIKVGSMVSKAPVIAWVDADGSTSPSELDRLVKLHSKLQAVGVIGSRYLSNSRILGNLPLRRRIASRSFNLLARFLLDLPYYDTQCGAKVFYRKDILPVLRNLRFHGWTFDLYVLYTLKSANKVVVESPIVWINKEGSKLILRSAIPNMLLAILKIWFFLHWSNNRSRKFNTS